MKYHTEKTAKDMEDLNKINVFYLTDIYRTLYSKFQRLEIRQCIFSDCSGITL